MLHLLQVMAHHYGNPQKEIKIIESVQKKATAWILSPTQE